MTIKRDEVRRQMGLIVAQTEGALDAIRALNDSLGEPSYTVNDAINSALAANLAAVTLLNRMLDEGVEGDA